MPTSYVLEVLLEGYFHTLVYWEDGVPSSENAAHRAGHERNIMPEIPPFLLKESTNIRFPSVFTSIRALRGLADECGVF